ncbi:TIGR02450 family Trp-rich protein [Simiduia curdlanivorans]|uniref:TIGR02450 family Trp-rich protein n=1 Tax=Simiduia curdlanivorans TaxID=1492769 RepID=A0ABV8V273_9GAMM|nr:TIGR02450 family Trp-rich protein [Simiduia curdlanivorans]MDN3637353.1 TIGR02450 family Trp-rich protein [Simiduia curdlanivorans]
MNNIKPKKLLNSKWTAVTPKNREKHFLVTEVEFDQEGTVTSCILEAVLSKRSSSIDWHDLTNNTRWLHGWQ